MGKCKFQNKWLDDELFKVWLKAVEGKPFEAFCCVCKKKVKLCTMGVNALKSHMQSESHKLAMKMRQKLTVPDFYAVSNEPSALANVFAASAAATASAASRAGTCDLRVAFGLCLRERSRTFLHFVLYKMHLDFQTLKISIAQHLQIVRVK